MKLLVTGGCGFIGSNFIVYWNSEHTNDEIVNIDNMTYASNPIFNSMVKDFNNYDFVKGDISSYELVESLVKDVDIVINFAAESHVDNSIKNSKLFVKSNFEGVHSILESVRKYDVRFHQVSTDEVYGSLGPETDIKFNAKSPYNPRNPYSATKASADFLVRSYVNTYGIRATISNCGNNYGPMQHPEKLVPKTILNALKGIEIPVYGDGKQIRDWIFVEDHCTAIDAILNKGHYGETYLIGADSQKRNIDVVTRILNLLGSDEDLVTFVEDRPGHDERYALDSTDTRNSLGWNPKVNFDEGILRTVSHYKDHFFDYTQRVAYQ